MTPQDALEELDDILSGPGLHTHAQVVHCSTCREPITPTSAVGIAAARIRMHLLGHLEEPDQER